jgi:CRISPR/Cas system-associated exonuclease Cas4 (RecB family)
MIETFDFEFEQLAQSSLRLSVSALRDYRSCPRYYYEKRINKRPEKVTHHMAAGNIVHDSFYMAYGRPVMDSSIGVRRVSWEPHGSFTPHHAQMMFRALWQRVPVGEGSHDKTVRSAEKQELLTLERLPSELRSSYEVLASTTPFVKNFVNGQTKRLKGSTQAELKEGWGEHFQEMLDNSLTDPLPFPVIDIEREYAFQLGGVSMKMFGDLVLDASKKYEPGAEIGVDLKSGYSKPSEDELMMDDQMQTYYVATGAREFWLYHLRSGEIFPIERSEPLIESLHEMAAQDAISIENEFFPRRYDKSQCARCAYRKACHGV